MSQLLAPLPTLPPNWLWGVKPKTKHLPFVFSSCSCRCSLFQTAFTEQQVCHNRPSRSTWFSVDPVYLCKLAFFGVQLRLDTISSKCSLKNVQFKWIPTSTPKAPYRYQASFISTKLQMSIREILNWYCCFDRDPPLHSISPPSLVCLWLHSILMTQSNKSCLTQWIKFNKYNCT